MSCHTVALPLFHYMGFCVTLEAKAKPVCHTRLHFKNKQIMFLLAGNNLQDTHVS